LKTNAVYGKGAVPPFSLVLRQFFVAGMYVAGAQLGFFLAFLHSQVSPVWPPEGISLAFVLLWGYRVAPGVLAGAFLANYIHNPHLPTAILIGIGNTSSVLLAAYLIRFYSPSGNPFARVRSVLIFLTIGTMPGAAVSAFIGVTSLLIFSFVPASVYWNVVLTWWTGEMQGLIIVAPFVYTWSRLPQIRWSVDRSIEAPLLLGSLVALAYIVFSAGFDLTYLPIPFIIWAIFRFKMHGAVSAIIIISFASIYYTIRQQGPFAVMRGDQLSINDSLLLLELYIGVFTIMTMVLAATIQEREEYIVSEQQFVAAKAKGEFLATLSHEIRTPLNGVIGSTELMRTTELSHEQKKYMDTLSGTAKTLAGLVNSILDYSKLEAGKLQIENIAFDLASTLTDIKAMFAHIAEKKGIDFKVEYLNLPSAVMGDPLRLTQILVNLCGNAIKFTEKGWVTLIAEYADGHCNFSVRDTGIGMRAEDQEKLFKPFQQAKTETARKFGGTGLGLTISAELAKLMNSRIQVESAEGKGSTFTFSIPMAGTDANLVQRATFAIADAEFAKRNPIKILIVDDTDVNRLLLLAMLEKLGFTDVDERDDGFTAVDAITGGAYGLVLLDVQMPGMDGVEVAQAVKKVMARPPRLVAVTGNVDAENRIEYAKYMDDFMPKPFTIDMLKAAIERAANAAVVFHSVRQ